MFFRWKNSIRRGYPATLLSTTEIRYFLWLLLGPFTSSHMWVSKVVKYFHKFAGFSFFKLLHQEGISLTFCNRMISLLTIGLYILRRNLKSKGLSNQILPGICKRKKISFVIYLLALMHNLFLRMYPTDQLFGTNANSNDWIWPEWYRYKNKEFILHLQ